MSANHTGGRFADDLSNSILCQQNEQMLRSMTEEWHTVNRELKTYSDDLSVSIQRIIVEPIKRLQSAFKEIRGQLKKRDNLHQDIVNNQAKVAKMSKAEKTGANLVKLEQAKQGLLISRYDNQLIQS